MQDSRKENVQGVRNENDTNMASGSTTAEKKQEKQESCVSTGVTPNRAHLHVFTNEKNAAFDSAVDEFENWYRLTTLRNKSMTGRCKTRSKGLL